MNIRDPRAYVLDGDVMADPTRRQTAIEASAVVSQAARAAAAMLARSPGILPPSWWMKVLKPDHRDLTGASERHQKSTSEQPTGASAVEETASPVEGESKSADKETADRASDALDTVTATLRQSGFTSADGNMCMTEETADRAPHALDTVTAALRQSGFTSADGSLCMTEFGLVFAHKTSA